MCKGNGGNPSPLIHYYSTHSQVTFYPISHPYFSNPLKVSTPNLFFNLFGKWGEFSGSM